jgi:DNA-binding MarR family transcriptional regulator
MTPDRDPAETSGLHTQQLASMARLLLKIRRKRETQIPGILFGEPSWDILLDLYVRQAEGRSVGISSLCVAAAVPTTTALRWIKAMVTSGQLVRQSDPTDRRRTYVRLSHPVQSMLENCLADARQLALATIG